jgi:hypothetical protein
LLDALSLATLFTKFVTNPTLRAEIRENHLKEYDDIHRISCKGQGSCSCRIALHSNDVFRESDAPQWQPFIGVMKNNFFNSKPAQTNI